MSTNFFGTVRPKNFAGKRDTFYYTWNLWIPQLFWNTERKPTKHFGTVRQKTFNWKMRYPLQGINFFVTPKLSESLKGCPQNFSTLWDRYFSQEKRDILYYTWNFSIPQLFWNIERMPTKFFGTRRPKTFAEKTCYLLLCIKLFDTLIFLKRWRNVHKTFRQYETKIFRRKFFIPPIIHKMFRYLKLSETLKGCPKKLFGTMRSKIFAEKTWYPLLYMKLFDTPSFLKHWTGAHKKFRHCETKNFQLKNAISLTMHQFLRYPQIIWIFEGMPTKFFGSLRPKFFAEKTLYPLLYKKLFYTPTFLKPWTEAHKKFRHCETKNFQLKNAISLTMHQFLRYPQIIWIFEGMPTKFFGSLRPKFFAEKTLYPLLYMKLFDTPTFLKHWTDAHKIFRHKATKNFRRKNVLPFIMYKVFRYPNFSETLKECPQNFSAIWDKNFSTEIFYTPYYP